MPEAHATAVALVDELLAVYQSGRGPHIRAAMVFLVDDALRADRQRGEAAEAEVQALIAFLARWRYRQPECPWCQQAIHGRGCELVAVLG